MRYVAEDEIQTTITSTVHIVTIDIILIDKKLN